MPTVEKGLENPGEYGKDVLPGCRAAVVCPQEAMLVSCGTDTDRKNWRTSGRNGTGRVRKNVAVRVHTYE